MPYQRWTWSLGLAGLFVFILLHAAIAGDAGVADANRSLRTDGDAATLEQALFFDDGLDVETIRRNAEFNSAYAAASSNLKL